MICVLVRFVDEDIVHEVTEILHICLHVWLSFRSFYLTCVYIAFFLIRLLSMLLLTEESNVFIYF